MNVRTYWYDLKKLAREPILILFLIVPFFAVAAVKALVVFGMPLLYGYTGFDLSPYLGYLEAFMLLLAPGMLGAVAAFLMIDERDGGIYTLMSVTPLGFSGYIANRLALPFALSAVYTLVIHFILNFTPIAPVYLAAAALLSGMQAVSTGLVLFSIADDKVKGLTVAKALDSLMLTAAADLLGIPWVSAVSAMLPFYWTTRLVVAQPNAGGIMMGIAVNALWAAFAVALAAKRR